MDGNAIDYGDGDYEKTVKSSEDITLYDLMADDYDVWLSKHEQFGFNLEVEGLGDVIIKERRLHPYAAESLANFCKRYLKLYENLVS